MQFLIDIALAALYFSVFLLFCAWSWRFWMMYINQKFLASLDWVILEIKLPREITKSPLATETAIAALLQSSGVGTKYARGFEGKLATFSSLEIASIEGVIHFYIRIQKKFKKIYSGNLLCCSSTICNTRTQNIINRALSRSPDCAVTV
jgi:hypothetical protein